MKTFALFAACSGLAFAGMGYHLGMFEPAADDPRPEFKAKANDTSPPPILARFPEDLLAAARWQPAPNAAEYKPGDAPSPLVFFKTDGNVHSWQEKVGEGWRATSVEMTQLVVVVGKDKETLLGVQYYPNNAPPVRRVKFELEIAVVAAKSGKVLARQPFVAMPREIRPVEAWELTLIGQPVSFHTVYNWVMANSRRGFKS